MKINKPKQLEIITKRIADRIGVRGIHIQQPLAEILSKEDYSSVEQMINDEYQLDIEKIDTIRDIAFILQNKIEI